MTKKNIKKSFKIPDNLIRLLVFILIFLIFGSINPRILSLVNIFSLLNNMVFLGLLALGLMVTMVTGNIDLSIPAIATLASYVPIKIFTSMGTDGNFFLALLISIVVGMLCGIFNAFIIYKFKIPGVVVSIATSGIYFPLFFLARDAIGTVFTGYMPKSLIKLNQISLIRFESTGEGLIADLNISILFLVFFAIVIWFVLNKTMVGRGIFALGGNQDAAKRIGFNNFLLLATTFSLMGAIAGVAGLYFSSISMVYNATIIAGKEITAIAAVIIGGTQFAGGKGGSVLGTLTGVSLITLIENNLYMIKVPSYAQLLVIGSIILISVTISNINVLRKKA